VHPPGDKSISHRAAILNSVADGDAKVSNFARSQDCLSTVSCLRSLGASIDLNDAGEVAIRGAGAGGLREAEDVLDAGNSGTTMRLLTGLLASLPFLSILTGDDSLRSRPMRRIIEPLRLMGAQIWGRDGDSRAPLVVKGGNLHGIEYSLPVPSAQLKSALLLAGLSAEGDTVVVEPAPSRDHTERLLGAMGAKIEVDGEAIRLSPGGLRAVDVAVPGDMSAAAFWLVAGAIHPKAEIKVSGVGINPTRSGVIDVLRSMGATLTIENERVVSGERVADLRVESSTLNGIEIGGELVPRSIDEIPVIALAAACARGKTVIRDAQELRVKESDRIGNTVRELSKMGARVDELPDGMVIHGGGQLHGAECDSQNDHRVAMMLGVAALVAGGETTIDNAEAVDISYSGFWSDLEGLCAAQGLAGPKE
jgi:3-phosphoshikimate 1-carboxyvinyltransferase